MNYYTKQEQRIPLITPDMFRNLPDQTCDILNRLIRFYEQYRDDSYNAITQNTVNVIAADDVINGVQTDITNIHGDLNSLATVAHSGDYNDLINRPPASVNPYPVGSIYLSVSNTNPGTLFGGTWVQIKDKFLLAAGDTYTAGSTGGEATHVLTVDEMPSHSHGTHNSAGARGATSVDGTSSGGYKWHDYGGSGTTNTGGGQAHNNMPPYVTVYMWQRTA